MQLLSKSSIWTVGVLFILLEIHYAHAMTSDGCAELGEYVEFFTKLMNSKGNQIGDLRWANLTLNDPTNNVDQTLIGAGFGWAYPIELTGDPVIPSDLKQFFEIVLYCSEFVKAPPVKHIKDVWPFLLATYAEWKNCWKDFIQYTPGSVRDRLHRAGIIFESNAAKTDTSGSVGDLTESHPVKIEIKVKIINGQGIRSVPATDKCGKSVTNKIKAGFEWGS